MKSFVMIPDIDLPAGLGIESAKAKGQCYRLDGPEITVLGYIPYLRSTAGTAYARLGTSGLNFGMRLALLCGNHDTPDVLAHPDDWNTCVRSKEYRVLMRLRCSLLCGANGIPLELDYTDKQVEIGYTPLRLPGTLKPAAFIRGTGYPDSPAEDWDPHGQWAAMEYGAHFRLHGFVNAGNRAITAHWAPYAWIRVRYCLSTHGRVGVTLQGSYIPSFRLFRAGGLEFERDMLHNTGNDVRNFVTAGRNQDAPGTTMLHRSFPANITEITTPYSEQGGTRHGSQGANGDR